MKATAAAAKYVLAVDLGTSGAKVALIGVDGRVAAWESEPVTLRVLPGGAEQAPEDWWRALVAATRRLLARHSGSAADVAAVCCSSQSEGTVPVDRAVYDERYQTFLEIHKRMRPLYRRVNRDSPVQPGGARGAT